MTESPASRQPRHHKGAVEAGVLRDLAKLPDDLQKGGVAAAIKLLARQLDEGGMTPRDAAGHVARIQLGLAQLREWNPAGSTGDGTDASREQMENVRALYAVQE